MFETKKTYLMKFYNHRKALSLGEIPGAQRELLKRLTGPRRKPSRWPIVLFAVLVVVALATAAFFYLTFFPL